MPWVTLLLQIHYRIQHHCSWSSFLMSTHNHTPHYITLLPQVLQYTAFYITALCDTSFTTSTSPYSALRHCPRSHFFLNYITILHFMSLFWVTLFLQVHRHRAHYVTVLGHTFSYKYMAILHSTSLPCVHQHAALYFATLNHIIPASVSSMIQFMSLYIIHFMSL